METRAGTWAACLAVLLSVAGRAGAEPGLFDDTVVHEIRLYLNPADWKNLRARYLENTYYPCDFVWRGLAAENVAVRSRGNGSRDPVKPALRLDFNRYEPGRDFQGVKALVLSNLKQDAPMLRNALAMLMFRRMGLPAPRTAYARLYVNNAYAGLYLVIEEIDKRFLKRAFGEDGGYLYDYDWCAPYRLQYFGPDPAIYSPVPFQPKTHESDPDPGPLVDLIRTVNQVPEEDFVRAISKYLDLDKFVEYLALENFIVEQDGFLGAAGINNFYLYRFEGKQRFQFIAWDKDDTFSWAEFPLFHNVEDYVLARRALAVPQLRRHYLDTLLQCADMASGGAAASLEQEARWRYELIRAAALEDSQKQYANQEFENAVTGLVELIPNRIDFVRRAVAAEGN